MRPGSASMLAEHYPLIKAAHVTLVALSASLFLGRGIAVLTGTQQAMRPAWRHLSYLIDTGLLTAAVLLLAALDWAPLGTAWLITKLALLPVYIVLGSLALKRARTAASRRLAFALALACLAAMAVIAHWHHPLGPLAATPL